MAYTQPVVTLENSSLFRHLPAVELKPVLAAAREKSFAPGQDIFKEGEPADGVYVVKSGHVEISSGIGAGQRHVFARVAPGDSFGEMAVLEHHPRSATASAVEATEVFFVPREPLAELLVRSPRLCLTLLEEVSRRIRDFNHQYVRALLQSERMALVGRFAGSIVHDLKNPLSIISVGAEMACLESATPEARQTAWQRIHRQIDRITGMVNDILEFTRGGSSPHTFALVDYATFVRGTVEELDQEMARKSVAIEFRNPPPALKLPIHPQRLGRVFYNLMLNAADEMPGGGRIQLRFESSETEVLTELADTGGGIAPEIADTLFEPFATHGKVKGTGLGLSISRRIIEEHGGRIWARNEAGGAVFAFTLPRLKASVAS
jgi:signal transduction histidine kinase